MNAISNPLVSVIIPAYNTAHCIGRALESVCKQSYRNVEIIVVDDGSSDNLADVMSGFTDSFIRFARHNANRGASAARNTGIGMANGEYIAFLDSDDRWHLQKLERQVEVMQHSLPNIGVIYTGLRWIRESDGRMIQEKIPDRTGDLSRILLAKDCIGSLSTPLIRSEAVRAIGGLDERLPARQDWDLWIRLSKIYQFGAVPDVLVDYYVHPGSISSNVANKRRGTEMVIEKFRGDFLQYPEALSIHYLVLTIFYLLEDDVKSAREYARRSLSADRRNPLLYWKNAIHYMLSYAHPAVRRRFFRLMQRKNADLYWIASNSSHD